MQLSVKSLFNTAYLLGNRRNIYMSSTFIIFNVALFLSMLFAILLTAYHRYMVIYEHRAYIFTKKRLFLLCLACYCPLVWEILVLTIGGFVKRVPTRNTYTFALPYEMLFLAIVTLIVFPIYLVWLKRLVSYLWTNMAEVALTLQKTEEEIRREKRVVKAMLIQGLLPVFSAAPAGITFLAISISGPSPLEDYRIPFLGYTIQSLMWIFAYLNPVFDSCATFFIVKAYSEAFKATVAGWLDALKKKCSRKVAPVQNNLGNVGNANRNAQKVRHKWLFFNGFWKSVGVILWLFKIFYRCCADGSRFYMENYCLHNISILASKMLFLKFPISCSVGSDVLILWTSIKNCW